MKEPYLQITLNDIGEVPKVLYKGKEIKDRQEILFRWETDGEVIGGTTIKIQHWDNTIKIPTQKTIIEKTLGHTW